MNKYLLSHLFIFMLVFESKAQNTTHNKTQFHSQSFGIQTGLSLLENPFILYQFVGLSYSKTILGHKRHQLAVLPQVATILLPDIERKFLVSASLQYKYASAKRVEANIFLGLNYQLRRLAYDRYQFEDNTLKNKGRSLYQFGPVMGFNVGYKAVRRTSFSISPFLGMSLIKLSKNYQSNLFVGYKPSVAFGVTLNK